MYKYFEQLQLCADIRSVTEQEIYEYKNKVISEMKALGAREEDINLLNDEMIRCSIINNHKPYDTAWSLLQ